MNPYISDIVTGLITAIITWISGRFLTLFRQRQLYLVIHKPMNFPYGDEQNYKVSAIILNKGRDKETNIKILFPLAQKINILASNYESITSEGSKLLVDRILPGDEIRAREYLSLDFNSFGKSPASTYTRTQRLSCLTDG